MLVRIGPPRAAEPKLSELAEAIIGSAKLLLAGKDQQRRVPTGLESSGDRSLFDGFRSGADHQPDVGGAQSSP